MTTQASVRSAQRVNVQFVAPAMQLSETSQAAANAMDNALAFGAAKAGLPGPEAALSRLRMGDPVVAEYWRYGLAQQIGHYVGELDKDVQGIYVADYDATAEDIAFGTPPAAASLIHLIVWVARKTAALTALLDALDRSLVAECARRLDMDRLTHLLDAQVVDDVAVKDRSGYGAMLASTNQKPIQIWKRA